jgi:hypothetical protein
LQAFLLGNIHLSHLRLLHFIHIISFVRRASLTLISKINLLQFFLILFFTFIFILIVIHNNNLLFVNFDLLLVLVTFNLLNRLIFIERQENFDNYVFLFLFVLHFGLNRFFCFGLPKILNDHFLHRNGRCFFLLNLITLIIISYLLLNILLHFLPFLFTLFLFLHFILLLLEQ